MPAPPPAPEPAATIQSVTSTTSDIPYRDKWGIARPGPMGPIPSLRFVLTNTLAGRVNALGLENFTRVGLQKRLYHGEHKDLLRDNFFFFGFGPRLSPAFAKLGPMIELQLLSILNIRLVSELVTSFNALHYFQSFATPSVDYSDSQMRANDRRGRSYSTTGWHFGIEPTLQLRGGPIVFRNRFAADYFLYNLRSGDRVFYEPNLDTAVASRGWVLTEEADLLYMSRFRFVAGLRYTLIQPLYGKDDVEPGESARALSTKNRSQRLGPLLAYTFHDRGRNMFSRPSLVLILQWYIQQRFRTGADTNAGLPLIALAFVFQSDFLK